MLPRALRRPDAPPSPPDAAAGGALRPRRGRAAQLLRRHWLIFALLVAGLALRVLATAGYQPALIYVDTLKYLYGASPGSEPLAYTALLRMVLAVGNLTLVTVLQHLAGLAMAVTLYLLLARRGAARWLSALAAAPVLLDAYQVQMEQTIMPDVWFEVMIVAGLAVLLWRPAVTWRVALAAGAILGFSATVKQLGVVLVLPALLYLLVLAGGWRRFLTSAVALGAAFALPILAYCSYSYARYGHFWLARSQPSIGRMAAAADCATLKVPPLVRSLCPAPAQQALGPDWLEHSGRSPLFASPLPPTAHRGLLIRKLRSAILSQQPERVAAAIVRDSLRLFALTRQQTLGVTPIARWQFQAGYPTYPPWTNICPGGQLAPADCLSQQHELQRRVAPLTDVLLRPGGVIIVGVQYKGFTPFHASPLNPSYGGPAQVNQPIAAFLHSYQLDGGYSPGPLLALCVLAGLAGSLLAVIRRRSGGREPGPGATAGPERAGRAAPATPQALACLLFTATAAAALLPPDVYQFSWRYELPAVVTLVPAGALGIAALLAWRRGRATVTGRTLAG